MRLLVPAAPIDAASRRSDWKSWKERSPERAAAWRSSSPSATPCATACSSSAQSAAAASADVGAGPLRSSRRESEVANACCAKRLSLSLSATSVALVAEGAGGRLRYLHCGGDEPRRSCCDRVRGEQAGSMASSTAAAAADPAAPCARRGWLRRRLAGSGAMGWLSRSGCGSARLVPPASWGARPVPTCQPPTAPLLCGTSSAQSTDVSRCCLSRSARSVTGLPTTPVALGWSVGAGSVEVRGRRACRAPGKSCETTGSWDCGLRVRRPDTGTPGCVSERRWVGRTGGPGMPGRFQPRKR
mmetsp:Transcript_17746/g.45875  ORF Transcript_17746/g.45875 Transcript_17746/m.45875 type:complete len:300 (+) Transcript_17746:403-1302(+)